MPPVRTRIAMLGCQALGLKPIKILVLLWLWGQKMIGTSVEGEGLL